MLRIGPRLVCGLFLAGLGSGCGTENPPTAETQSAKPTSAPAESLAQASSDSTVISPNSNSTTQQSTAELPELLVPGRTTDSLDTEVQPAAAVKISTLATRTPLAAGSREAGQAALADLVEAYRTGQPEQYTRAETAIHACGVSVLPTLLDGLVSSDRLSRELASMMLAQLLPDLLYAEELSPPMDRVALIQGLRQALEDDSVEVRANAAVALSLIEGEGPQLVPVFLELLMSELPHVRTMSVVALGGLGVHATPAIPAMERLSQTDPDPTAKAAAIEALNLLRSQP